MNLYEPTLLRENLNLTIECSKCKELIMLGSTPLLEIDVAKQIGETVSSLIEVAALKCGQEHFGVCSRRVSISSRQFFLFVYFKEPRNMQIPINFKLFGESFKYKCHICDIPKNGNSRFEAHFVQDNIQFVNDAGTKIFKYRL